jgi:hypothetical protein
MHQDRVEQILRELHEEEATRAAQQSSVSGPDGSAAEEPADEDRTRFDEHE